MNLRIFDTIDDLLQSAARTVVQRAQAGAKVIALSGGSTPQPLYELLGRTRELDSLPLTWVMVDERDVPIDHTDSNAGMIQKTLFASGMAPAHRFLRFRTELGEPALTARDFEDQWRFLALEQLDVVILGLGDDGHTASLFPGTPVLQVEDRVASEVYVPRLGAWRVTLTKPVLRAAKLRMVLVAGAKKRPILEQVQAGAERPIVEVTRDAAGETWWFVDREAAPR